MAKQYLLRTKPQGERKAVDGIIRCGHTAWYPTEERVMRSHRYSKKKRIVRYPLAPRYVIAEATDPHGLIHDVAEVSGVVGSLREPDVARLQAMNAQKAETIIGKSMAVGQPIVVRDGPFREHRSTIDAIDGHDATIKLDILGKATPVTMPLAFLDPL